MYSPVKAPAVVLDVEKRSAPAEARVAVHNTSMAMLRLAAVKECTTGDILQQPALVMRWIDRYTLLPNLQNPRSYTKRQKGLIVFVVSLASFSAP